MKKRVISLAAALMMVAVAVVAPFAVTVQAAEPWRDAYAAFLRNPANYTEDIRSVWIHYCFMLHDLDNNGTPELIIINAAAPVSATSYIAFTYAAGAVKELGKIGRRTDDILSVSDHPDFPGLFSRGTIMGTDWLYYSTIKNGALDRTLVYQGESSYPYEGLTDLVYPDIGGNRTDLTTSLNAPEYVVNEANIQRIIYGWTSPTAKVTINNTPVNFTGQAPVIVGGRTLVPVRGVFEALGFSVSWNPETRQATLSKDNDTIVITIGSATFTTNGASHTLDVPAQIIGGSTMIPLRAVLESVGYGVAWDGDTRTVIITTN